MFPFAIANKSRSSSSVAWRTKLCAAASLLVIGSAPRPLHAQDASGPAPQAQTPATTTNPASPDGTTPKLPTVVVTEPNKRNQNQGASESKKQQGRAARRRQEQAKRTAPPVTGESPAPVSPPLDGSAAAGYRVGTTTAAGPIWGGLSQQDTPYSVSIVSSQLIDNLQAYSIDDLTKVIPQITGTFPLQNANGNSMVQLRGFSISQFTNNAGVTYNGMLGGAGGMFYLPLEDKERVEVLSGVDGFLYGTGSVGGNINYVTKRPTADPYAAVTVGDNAGANGFVHGDFGGLVKGVEGIADGVLGYRLNVVGQTGDTSIQDQSVNRGLISAAFDFHLPTDLLLQFNFTHSNYHVYGTTPEYTSTLNPYPSPPNPATQVANPWLQFSDQTDTAGTNLTWHLNDTFTLRAAYSYTYEQRPTIFYLFDTIKNYQGLATPLFLSNSQATAWSTNSGYTFLDTNFEFFGIHNKLTTGFTGFTQDTTVGSQLSTLGTSSQTFNVYDQTPVNQPLTTTVPTAGYRISNLYAKNFIIGDQIDFTDKFTVLGGGNYTTLGTAAFNSGGLTTAAYNDGTLTPSVSLIYKVVPWLTTYATYQQSLQSGGVVQNTGSVVYTNNGAVLPPYIGDQYEVGAKATVAKNLLLTAALFEIDKANQYQQPNANGTFTEIQSGREVHKGIELTATGKIWNDLTIIGGVTIMDARVTADPANPAFVGSIPAGVSPVSEKIYVEYDLPYFASVPFLRGLTLIGGVHYASDFYVNQPNTTRLPGYAVEDLGLRYTTRYDNHPLIFRFNVNNITNKAYWVQSTYVGLGRTYLASAQIKF